MYKLTNRYLPNIIKYNYMNLDLFFSEIVFIKISMDIPH